MSALRPARAAIRAGFAALLASAVLAPVASADLRSPRLESSCETDYAYSEVRVGPFVVEGCNKEGTARGEETARWRFTGDVEVNGLLVEPTSGDDALIAATSIEETATGQKTNGSLDRSQSTRLVLDPLIGGQRRRIVISDGPLHLDGQSSITLVQRDPDFSSLLGGPRFGSSLSEPTARYPGGGVRAPKADFPAERLGIGVPSGSTELPVGGVPSLLGLRLVAIEEVQLGLDGMSFDVELKLGSGAPGLMRDVLGTATVELVDGEGMQVTDLRFRIGHIGIDGIGGIDHFRVTYDGGDDEWSGGFDLELGGIFPGLEFDATVSASTGVPSAMRLALEPLNIPLGPTGITLQSVRAGFDLSPLTLSGGAGIAAGPSIGGWSVLTADGDLTVAIEPNFRFEAAGTVRVFPTSATSELARGDVEFIYDSSGLISLSGNARFEATAAGVGISAQISGSGAYSSSSDVFNIAASASGNLELGFLGSVQIVQLKAAVSSDGFGTCGKLFTFLSAGIGQEWGHGGLQVFTGCDLGPYKVNVARASRAERLQQGAGRITPVLVPRGQEQVAIQVGASRTGVPMRLLDPDGNVVVAVEPGARQVGPDVVAINSPRDHASGLPTGRSGFSPVGVIALRRPQGGRYRLQTPAGAPPLQVRVAADAKPLGLRIQTSRTGKPGERRLRVRRTTPVDNNETIQIGFRTPTGVEPIGEPFSGDANLKFLEQPRPGRRQIVAQVVRDGIPVPGRVEVVGSHTAQLPKLDGRVRTRRQGHRLRVQARAKAGSERPEGFEYRITQNGKTGVIQRPAGVELAVWLPEKEDEVLLAVHPIFRGVALERVRKVVRIP